MAQFNKGDEVSYVGGTSGKTIACIVDGGIGTVQVHWKDNPMTFRMIEASNLTLIKAAPVTAPSQVVAKPKMPVYRYVCMECGKKHNNHACPVCGSDEKIGNTGHDIDMSEFLGGTPAERYTPRDEE